MSGTLPPLLALALGRGDHAAVRRTLGAGVRAYALVAAAALAGGLLIALFSGSLIRVEPDLLRDLRTAGFVGLIGLFLYPLLPFQSLLDAQQRGYVFQAVNLTQSLITTALGLALARAGWGITGQLVALTTGQVVLRASVLFVAARGASAHGPVLEPPDAEAWRAIRSLNVPTFLTSLAGKVGFYTDNLIVGLMLGPAQVAMLFLTQRLAGVAGTQLLGVGNASWAALAQLHAMGRRETFNARLLDLTRVVAGLSVAALVPIVVFNRLFVTRWVGPGNYGGELVTMLACVNAWLLAVQSLWGWCFGGTGLMRVFTPIAIASAALNVVASLAATKLIGLAGPLLGTTIAVAATHLWLLPLRLRQHFGASPAALLGAALTPLLWGAPAAALLAWLVPLHEPPFGWLGLLGEMALTGLLMLGIWWGTLPGDARAVLRERLQLLRR